MPKVLTGTNAMYTKIVYLLLLKLKELLILNKFKMRCSSIPNSLDIYKTSEMFINKLYQKLHKKYIVYN